VPHGAFGYLHRMRRSDGSYRYSARYVTTPVWVTAQVLPALARQAFPLKASLAMPPSGRASLLVRPSEMTGRNVFRQDSGSKTHDTWS
jgi:hypothetical protein